MCWWYTPLIGNLTPEGKYNVVELQAIGGLPLVMKHLLVRLDSCSDTVIQRESKKHPWCIDRSCCGSCRFLGVWQNGAVKAPEWVRHAHLFGIHGAQEFVGWRGAECTGC